ncbi:MAG: hypothetical protein E3K37_12405 [Candidatus Kuenenia sp.]|nr:hypothetical protein [Candidatus Kuenenia hertensis]
MIKQVVIVWQNPINRSWIPVGKLSYKDTKFFFQYTNGANLAKNAGHFVPFGQMLDLDKKYEADELFPIFKNRLLQKSRPEYEDYLSWLNLGEDNVSPLDELARSGGIRVTDNLQMFPIPEKTNNRYKVTFFSHGIRHLPPNYIERIQHLSRSNRLYLMKDIQNNYDSLALALRTDDPPEIVGYCPGFFVRDFNDLLVKNGAKNVKVSVVRVNLESPVQFRLLCEFITDWPDQFIPFQGEDFETVKSK